MKNVHVGLVKFLKKQGINVISKPKGLSNGKLAGFSKLENMVLVTNDEDFIKFTRDKLYSVIWLRIPQREIELLKKAFSNLLNELKDPKDFEGNLIMSRFLKTTHFSAWRILSIQKSKQNARIF